MSLDSIRSAGEELGRMAALTESLGTASWDAGTWLPNDDEIHGLIGSVLPSEDAVIARERALATFRVGAKHAYRRALNPTPTAPATDPVWRSGGPILRDFEEH